MKIKITEKIEELKKQLATEYADVHFASAQDYISNARQKLSRLENEYEGMMNGRFAIYNQLEVLQELLNDEN